MDMEIIRAPFAWSPELSKVLLVKHCVGQNIALHALLTARKSDSSFCLYGSFRIIFCFVLLKYNVLCLELHMYHDVCDSYFHLQLVCIYP